MSELQTVTHNHKYFFTPSVFAEDHLVVCDCMGRMNTPGFYVNRNYAPDHILIQIHNGLFHVKQFGKHLQVHPGEVLLLNLRHPHVYYGDPDLGCDLSWIHFRGNPLSSLLNLIDHDRLLPSLISKETWKDLFAEAYSYVKDDIHLYETSLSGYLYSTVLQLIQPMLNELITKSVSKNYYFRERISLFIDRNIDRPLSLAVLSEHVHMSKYHFSHLFQSEFGESPMRYILKKRLRLAMQSLAITNDSIESICAQAGFTDQSYFSKQFKKYVGLSPSRYREQKRGELSTDLNLTDEI